VKEEKKGILAYFFSCFFVKGQQGAFLFCEWKMDADGWMDGESEEESFRLGQFLDFLWFKFGFVLLMYRI